MYRKLIILQLQTTKKHSKNRSFCNFKLQKNIQYENVKIQNYQLATTKYKLPTTNYQLLTTKYQIPNTKYQILNIKYQIPNTNLGASKTNHNFFVILIVYYSLLKLNETKRIFMQINGNINAVSQ